MKKLIPFLPLCFVASLQAAESVQAGLISSEVNPELTKNQISTVFEVGIDFWMMPRDAHRVMQEFAITQAVKTLLIEPESYLELRYPEGEMGEIWGQELQAWLVALGVVSDRIELQRSLEPIESIVLAVVNSAIVEDVLIPLDLPAANPETGLDNSLATPVVDEPMSQETSDVERSVTEEIKP